MIKLNTIRVVTPADDNDSKGLTMEVFSDVIAVRRLVNVCDREHGYKCADIWFDMVGQFKWCSDLASKFNWEVVAYFNCPLNCIEPE